MEVNDSLLHHGLSVAPVKTPAAVACCWKVMLIYQLLYDVLMPLICHLAHAII